MEMHEIRYFLAVSEALNFTRAAEACNVTQPALTRAVKSLEDKLGGPLIARERGNTHLTELGRLMKPYFEDVLGRMEEAQKRARDLVSMTEGTLTVGLMCTIGPSRLIDLFRNFQQRHDGVQLYLRDGAAGALERQLAEGELDVAIYCKSEPLAENMHAMPLFSERFVIACAPAHPLARLEKVHIGNLEGHSYLSRANCEYRDHIRQIREEMGVKIKLPYASERDDWIQSMALAGLGFTVIPEFAVTLPGLVTRPLTEPAFMRTVNMVTVRGRRHSPSVGAFVHEARCYPWLDQMRRSLVAVAGVAA
jgi:DNA-binding transcriptional LysR family regulator